jgi:hypothetical protein
MARALIQGTEQKLNFNMPVDETFDCDVLTPEGHDVILVITFMFQH